MRQALPLLLSVVLVAPFWVSDAAAQRCPDCRRLGPMSPMGRMGPGQGQMRQRDPMAAFGRFAPQHLLERRGLLELSDEQAQRLGALTQPVREAHEKAQATVQERREHLIEAWQADQPDPGLIRSHAQAIMQAHQAAQLAAIEAAARAKAVLSDEQRGRLQGWAGARAFGRRGAMMHRPGRHFPRFRSFHGHRCPGC